MISLSNVRLQRGGKPILENASLTIPAGKRAALIGANGAGKSSLFQVLLGTLQVDAGEVGVPGHLRIAHMAQEVPTNQLAAIDHVLDGDQALREVQRAIAEHDENGNDMQLAAAYAQLEAIDGHTATVRAEKLLSGLGFSPEDFAKPTASFSGGWRIRLNLAQALMCPSDLLLLDEPTNHLDLDATIWLEQWLKAYPGTLILVSHDRDFIDSIATHIVAIERLELAVYTGNYSAYERQRAERLAQQQAQYVRQQKTIADMHRFVERFRAKATKAKQAQSRLKAMARMEMIAPAHVDSPFSFYFENQMIHSDPFLVLEDAALGYDKNAVLKGVNLSIAKGSRIGLLGANGAGKSTLVKTLVGSLPLIQGERVAAPGLRVGYFAQHQLDELDLNASPHLHIQRLSPNASEQRIRDFLGGFDFRGDMAMSSIRHFSGGEKARLALAIVVWQKPNLLVMDEPTNHLDIEMRHALNVALQGFEGSLLMVSHDRHLLRNSVSAFLLVAQQQVQPYAEDLDSYQSSISSRQDKTQVSPIATPTLDKKAARKLAAQQRAQLQPLKKTLASIENKMSDCQNRLHEIESSLADESIYSATQKPLLQQLLEEQGLLKTQLSGLEEQWFENSEALEDLTTNLE